MILHDRPNTAQYKTVQPVSIHDTPPPENLPETDALLSAYLQVPSDLKLTETNPPIEERVYIRAPSVTKVPFKKSRRTNRKQYKKPWRAKKLPTAWKYLAKKPAWEKLSKDDQMKLKVGWPNRYFCLSYDELAKTWGCTKRHAKRKIKQWEQEGTIEVFHEYRVRNGKLTKLSLRNYCVFTEHKGKKDIAKLVKFLGVDPKMSPPKDLPIGKDFCQVDSQVISTDEKIIEGESNLELEEPEAYHSFLEARFDELLANEEQLKPEVSTILAMSGFESEIPTLAPWLKKEINTRPIKQLVANLRWHELKRKAGYRIRNFWGSFVWVMKNGIPIAWMKKRANEYEAAIKGDTRVDGIDSQSVVEMIVEIQKRTGQKASKRDLHGLLCHGAIHLRAFLKIVRFKLNRVPIRNWIGYVHFLAKKSLVDLSDMYKSEEQIQAKCEADDALLRGARNHRHASDWDKLLSDLEEEDRLIATGSSGEIWD